MVTTGITNPVNPLKEEELPSRIRLEWLLLLVVIVKVPVPESVPFKSIVELEGLELVSTIVGLFPRGKLQSALIVIVLNVAFVISIVTALKVALLQA